MADDAPSMGAEFPVPFGKYLLTDLLAVGGMAEVYRAKIFGASGFEKEMVVKRILPKYAKNPSFVQMLIDEAKIAVSLSHGNIVPIYELGELEGSYYIAMEYVAGKTILDVLRASHAKQRPLGWPHALGLAAEVARGLAYAHDQVGPDGRSLGLVHRDINPRNIVITPAGEVKILDFGIARASTKKHQTASGVIKGTPGYMSPEQMYGRPMDHRSDIYCLGILLHELLTLRRLFPVWDVKEMRQMFEAGPVPLPSAAGLVDEPRVDEVVMRALAANVDERFQTATELEEALRTVIATSGVPVTATGLAREIAAIENTLVPPQVTVPVAHAERAPEPATTSERTRAAEGQAPSSEAPPPAVSPSTQPMQAQPAPASAPHDATAAPFIISLAGDVPSSRAPLEPLPKTSAAMTAPKTKLLAQNDGLEWSREIGDDAEMLAIAKAVAAHPGQTRRTLLIALAALVVALLFGGALYGPEAVATVQRAISGKALRNGALVVKTTPSGAEVLLDGKVIGKTNLKITGVDPDRPHQLVVKPEGMDPILQEFAPSDFKAAEDMPTFFWERDFTRKEEPTPTDADGAVENDDAKKAEKSQKRRKKGRK